MRRGVGVVTIHTFKLTSSHKHTTILIVFISHFVVEMATFTNNIIWTQCFLGWACFRDNKLGRWAHKPKKIDVLHAPKKVENHCRRLRKLLGILYLSSEMAGLKTKSGSNELQQNKSLEKCWNSFAFHVLDKDTQQWFEFGNFPNYLRLEWAAVSLFLPLSTRTRKKFNYLFTNLIFHCCEKPQW